MLLTPVRRTVNLVDSEIHVGIAAGSAVCRCHGIYTVATSKYFTFRFYRTARRPERVRYDAQANQLASSMVGYI